MEPATASPAPSHSRAPDHETRLGAAWTIVQYGLWVFFLSVMFSFLAKPWIPLSWWRIFRRCVSVAAALSLWVFVRKRERRSFRAYGFSAPQAGKRQFRFGLLLGLGTLGFMLGVGLASGACRIDVIPNHLRLWVTVLGFIPAAFLVGILEELVFRGFILQHLQSYSKVVAVIGSSALYALVHLKATTLDRGTWLELGGLFLLGGVLALSFLLTGQLYLAVGLHASLAYGARINKLFIQFPNPSLSWLVGTSRLINGIASWIAVLGIGGIIVWWVRSSYRGGICHENA